MKADIALIDLISSTDLQQTNVEISETFMRDMNLQSMTERQCVCVLFNRAVSQHYLVISAVAVRCDLILYVVQCKLCSALLLNVF